MGISTIVFIVILSVAGLVFLGALYNIFRKKKKKEKKKKEKKAKVPKAPAEEQVKFNADKLQKEPKLNKKKLQEVAGKESKIEPAFGKEELEKERQEELQKMLEKNKANTAPKNSFGFPGMPPFPFPNRSMPTPMSTQRETPRPFGGRVMAEPEPSKVEAPVTFAPNQEESEAFIEVLKERGVIKKEQTFGESLIIKEAVETPVSKQEMKSKRKKWL